MSILLVGVLELARPLWRGTAARALAGLHERAARAIPTGLSPAPCGPRRGISLALIVLQQELSALLSYSDVAEVATLAEPTCFIGVVVRCADSLFPFKSM